MERTFTNPDTLPAFIILADDNGYAIRLSCGNDKAISGVDVDDNSVTIHLVCPSTNDPKVRLPCLHSVSGTNYGGRVKRQLAEDSGNAQAGRGFQDGGAQYAEIPPEHMQRCHGIFRTLFSRFFLTPPCHASKNCFSGETKDHKLEPER